MRIEQQATWHVFCSMTVYAAKQFVYLREHTFILFVGGSFVSNDPNKY